MKKANTDMIKNVALVILSILVIVLGCILIFGNKVIKYKYYNDNLLNIKNNSSLTVKANVVDYNSLVIVLSNSNQDLTGVVNIKVYNDLGKKILDEENQYTISKNNKAISFSSLPDLKDDNAGKIEVTITEKSDSKTEYDLSKIKTETAYTVGEDNVVQVNLKLTNQLSKAINNIYGYVVAYQDDKIVAINSFNENDIKPNDTKEILVDLSATNILNEIEKLEFDKLEAIVTYIG